MVGTLRQRREPARRGDRERAQRTGADQRHHRERVAEQYVDLSAQDFGHRRRGALVGHDQEIDAGPAGKQHATEMPDGAVAGMGERNRLRLQP